MLTISHYTKTYPGGKTAVEDLSLHIPAGELCGFIGHNGAGKTTTLRAVAGVMSFTQGTIAIDGHDVRTDPIAAKAVTAFLPDNPDLYEFMSGIEYLNLIADLYDIPARQREERVRLYAASRTWVEKNTAPPASHSSRRYPLSRWAAAGSSPTKGSSNISSLGFRIRAEMMASFCFMPWE